MLLLPALILVFALYIFPLGYSIQLSFCDFKLTRSTAPTFNGLENYIKLFRDNSFLRMAKNTFVWVVGSNILHFIFGLGFALILNTNIFGKGIWRGIFLLSWVTPVVVVGIIWKWLLNVQWGLINIYLMNLSIIDKPIDWLGRGVQLMIVLTIINGWKAYGFMFLNYLSGLQSIPVHLYEAADVDGATGIKKFYYITLPMLRSIIVISLLLGVAWTFNDFNMIWVLTKGGPGYESMVYGTYVYKQAFEFYNIGYASAIGVFGFLIMIILAYLYLKKYEEV
jgi:multiple sugar transport system permease protein